MDCTVKQTFELYKKVCGNYNYGDGSNADGARAFWLKNLEAGKATRSGASTASRDNPPANELP